MDHDGIRKKLLRIMDTTPELKTIMLSADSLEEKRARVRHYLDTLIRSSFYDRPALPSLEWVLTRDAVGAFRTILSTRSEKLAHHSVLKYMNDLIHKNDLKNITKPGSGFFAEIDHLLRGIAGKSGIYPQKIPAFLEWPGRSKGS
jgi:lysine 2,3-aminomutase